MLKKHLITIVYSSDSFRGKFFDIVIQVLVVLSLLTFSIETMPHLDETIRHYLYYFECFSISVFTLEYLIRIYIAEKKLGYLLSFYGIIDLLAILPFYLDIFLDLRAVKVFSLFRLFRLFKLLKYVKTLDKFHKAMSHAKEEFIIFFMVTFMLFYLASIGIYFFENSAQPEVFGSIFDSMWWSVATLTTVGYGDAYPITVGGKIFTTFILLIGLGVVGIPAGIIASSLLEMNTKKKRKDVKKRERICMKGNKKVLILHGWGGSDFPHWQSHLALKIAKDYGTVSFPLLDNCHFPSKNRWLKQVKEILKNFQPDIVVCHSLANTLWFWLSHEELHEIEHLIMVSPPSLETKEKTIQTFFPCVKPKKLHAKKIDIFVSDNDPWVEVEEVKEIALHYNASFTIVKNGGHINADSGFGAFELVERLILNN